MKFTVLAFALIVFLSVPVLSQSESVNIVPRPQSIKSGTGHFEFSNKTKIVARDAAGRKAAGILNDMMIAAYGFKLEYTNKPQKNNAIVFAAASRATGAEQYGLTVEPKGIRISGGERGLFYGIQSLMQLLPVKLESVAKIPAVEIVDQPRFQYRGMMLDVGRHFMSVDFVKKFIDELAQFKFNYFHWHLTDDQGWRIEIKKYPKLTEVGSYRSESHEGSYTPAFKGDGTPHSGFYTQEQIKDVIAYAKARQITVIPEIELPGHASAALAAYPQFGCKEGYDYQVKKTWGIHKEAFCPTDETFKFLEDVLDETISLFPDSPYIHIGGDEVLKDHWKESAFVQELKKRENLKDEHEVQSYFVRRIEKFINSKGKKIIGWDEILEGGVAPNAIIMSWRGMKGGIEAAKAKHEVIMTPTDYAYLDYGQGDPAYELLNIGGYLPLEKVYSFEPVPAELTPDEAKYILGGQGNLWTEYIETGDKVEHMAFPRMLAMSEVVWSKKDDRNYRDFYDRMLATLPRLEKQGVDFRIPEPIEVGGFLLNETEAYAMEVRPPLPGAKVHYTKDGSNPTENSPEAPQKISVFPVGDEVVTIKTIVVLPSGRKSTVYAATFLRGKMLEPDATPAPTSGVNYRFSVPKPDMSGNATEKIGETKSIQLDQFDKEFDLKKTFAVEFSGFIKIPVDGIYEFQTDATWHPAFEIGGKKLIENWGTAERKTTSAIVPLKAGLHKIRLMYTNHSGLPHFRLRWGLKGRGLRQAYGGEFVH